MKKFEDVVGKSVQTKLDRDAAYGESDLKPTQGNLEEGPLPPSGAIKCRLCGEPIYIKPKAPVYRWEVANAAHVTCAKKYADEQNKGN